MIRNLIQITPVAKEHLVSILEKYNSSYIRFGLKSGGCSGFQYVLEPQDLEIKDEDLYKDDKLKSKFSKIHLCFLGTEIDWDDDIMGQRFVFKKSKLKFLNVDAENPSTRVFFLGIY